MSKTEKLLIVEDREADLSAYTRGLSLDYDVVPAKNLEEAQRAAKGDISLVLSDIQLSETDRTNRDGLVFLDWMKTHYPAVPVVMMTAYNDMDMAVQALNRGAEYFIRKPINLRELKSVLRNLANQVRLQRKAVNLERRLSRYEPWEIIGESEPIRNLRKAIKKAAEDSRVTILITGETGTGKELIARAIHKQGPRRDEPFIDESLKVREGTGGLIESLLFGHEKGAFTDALERHEGVFERSNGGVLFLDEIGELDSGTQVKLLRVLETRTFRRMGGTDDLQVDIQLVVATNRDLEKAVAQGVFRDDLYFRLNVFEIKAPPLREIASDIPAIANHILQTLIEQGRTQAETISKKAMALLCGYSWPGNVRELRNYIERAAIFADESIQPEHLHEAVRSTVPVFEKPHDRPLHIPEAGLNLDEELARTELKYMEAALKASGGRKNEAWKLLGLNDRFALTRKVKAIATAFPALLDAVPFLKQQYENIIIGGTEE